MVRTMQDAKFNLAYKPYMHRNVNTTDTKSPTCSGSY